MDTLDKNKNEAPERPLVSFDWAVKRMLRNKANFEVVEGFLSELLGRQVTITSVLESESNKEHSKDKFNRVDVTVENTLGEVILIELQFIPEMDYLQRMLYGVSKSLVERLVQGDNYMKLQKIFSINIVYFDLGQGKDYVYYGKTSFKGLHDFDTLHLSREQQRIFGQIVAGDLFPEYYILKINNFNNVAKNTLDEWVYFLKNDRIRENFTAKGLLKARDILDYSRLSPEERAEYNYAKDVKSHNLSQIATAKAEGRSEVEKKYAEALKERDKALKKKDKVIEKQGKVIEEQGKTLEEQGKTLEKQGKALEKQGKAFEKQGKTLKEQHKMIEELKQLLSGKI
ncbi:MAG: Rpn family recombination-promoting nuclease/putative transposase [Prevotellaceae bacterium]|jgi:predicted transposase/invertase (TIGR01784 family)|nr:Rpn family recombination-promoting nuclease/putative transposase [Prevotellaceae bacterium]